MQQIWEDFLKIIKEEAGSQVVETWFKAVCLEKWNKENCAVTLRVPNQFVSRWLQQHYTTLIKTHLARLLHTQSIEIFFACNDQNMPPPRKILPASLIHKDEKELIGEYKEETTRSTALVPKKQHFAVSKTKSGRKKLNNLNDSYSFSSFVVGPCNSLAHAAVYAISQNLGKVYNPLFIYGGTGLGKTHLLHALGNEVKKQRPTSIVKYETSDRFTNEFINSIRLDKTPLFREKYQRVDLLMLDDIQFLSNKQQTQESFFHIFNTLYEQGKQIILSSDTFPKEIAGLQNRLKSRLEWGLVADIQMPDLETKIAILKKKAEQHAIKIDDEVADFIASRITSNIRALEGALIRVCAFSTLTNQKINLEMVKRVLLNLNEKKKDGIMLDNVLKTVAKYYQVLVSDLKSKKRHKDISTIRQIAFYLMKKLTFHSLQTIGEHVGKRDHSTVLHSISKVENLISTDPSFAKKLKVVEQEILTN